MMDEKQKTAEIARIQKAIQNGGPGLTDDEYYAEVRTMMRLKYELDEAKKEANGK